MYASVWPARSRHRRVSLPGVLLVTAALVLAACSSNSSGSSSAPKTFVIGAILPLSGPLAPIGHDAKAGLSAAVAKVNSEGGILGRKVVVNLQDDAGDPTKAALAAKELIAEKPNLIIPGATSTELAATLPLTSQAKILTIAAPGSPLWNNVQKYPYHFQLIEPEANQSAALVPAVKQVAPGVKTIGAISEDDASAPPYIAAIKQDFTAADFKIADFETYAPDATNVTVQLQRLRNAGVKVIVVHALETEFLPVMDGLAQLNWTNVQVVGDESSATGDLSTVPASVASQYHGVAPAFLARTGSTAPASANMFTRYGGLQASLEVAYITYNIVIVDRWAVDAANSTDTVKVAAALESLRSKKGGGPTGMLGYTDPKFSRTDHSLSAMGYKNFWGLLSVSPNIDGTKIGVPLRVN